MKKKLLALFLALVMVGAVLPGCGDGSKDPGGQGNNGKTGEPVKGGEITIGIAQDLDDSLDPHQTVAAGTREVLFNIFEGLVKPNSDGEMIPAVAEKYTLSEDGTTYTFTLREGVKFHNGQTVTAEDVVYSINRCAAVPEGQEKPLVAAFSAVKSVEALDEKTVAVTIAQRDLEFISYMTAAIIPADYENQDTAVSHSSCVTNASCVLSTMIHSDSSVSTRRLSKKPFVLLRPKTTFPRYTGFSRMVRMELACQSKGLRQ